MSFDSTMFQKKFLHRFYHIADKIKPLSHHNSTGYFDMAAFYEKLTFFH